MVMMLVLDAVPFILTTCGRCRESTESSNPSMRLVTADAVAKEFLWDDRVEHGTVIYEQNACISVRRLQVL